MKTLSNPKDKSEIIERVQRVKLTSQGRWGKMSAHQMICHLNDTYLLYLGERDVSPDAVPYPRAILRWVALWVPIPWPKGFKTRPEIDQQVGGTQPVDFESDRQKLLTTIQRFVPKALSGKQHFHPSFGPMSERDWMRLAYLHGDHHLRQFGE